MLALAGWELRNNGAIRPDFPQVLDDVIRIPGRIGMEYRAILAERRAFLEAVAPAWLEINATTLFRDDELGRETFDLTLKYARPTRWFYSNFRDELFAATRRKADRAIALLLIGTLHEEDGYAFDVIINSLHGDVAALASAVNQMAFLVQACEANAPQLAIAVEFWRALGRFRPNRRSRRRPEVVRRVGIRHRTVRRDLVTTHHRDIGTHGRNHRSIDASSRPMQSRARVREQHEDVVAPSRQWRAVGAGLHRPRGHGNTPGSHSGAGRRELLAATDQAD